MQLPATPRLPTIPLPTSGVSHVPPSRRRTDAHRPRRRAPPSPPGPGIHASLAHGVLYNHSTRAFTAPSDGRRLPSVILDAPAARPPAHQRTAVVTLESRQTRMLISCPAMRPYVSVRDVLDAVDDALQHSHHAVGPTGRVVRVQVQCPSAGDYLVTLFQHPAAA